MRRLPKKADEIFEHVKAAQLDLERKDEKGNPRFKQKTRNYKLMTPLFGGGVDASEPDLERLITGKSVRGQLRFWWRAIRGGFGSDEAGLAAMKKKETELWGAPSTTEIAAPSHVQVVINVTSTRHQREWPFSDEKAADGWKELAYAAFPLQQEGNPVVSGIEFSMTITYPEDEKPEIEAALWAWETFGGVGGRTRRGFGAIRRAGESYPSKLHKIEEGIKTKLKEHIGDREEWHPSVPHLSKNPSFLLIAKEKDRKRVAFDSQNEAWEELVKALKSFRQKRDDKGYGRNKWPEPEQIRRLTGQRFDKHEEDAAMLSIQKFPRAAFGLPIIFHFKDGDKSPPDPVDTTLKGGLLKDCSPNAPKYRERLASPLIIRPLACGNDQAVGLALVLEAPHFPPEGLSLDWGDGKAVVEATINKTEASKIEALKKAPSTEEGSVDVLQAFLADLREKELKKEKQQ